MDSKKLAKLIKVIVEAEVAKKQEQFLSKTFPKILEEEVNRRVKKALREVKGGVSASSANVMEEEIDPFAQAEQVLQQERQEQPKRQFTKNQALNEVLNNTQPFSQAQRSGGQVGGSSTSVLDSFQQPQQQVQQIQENTHIPSYMDAEPDIDQTINMGSSLGAGGVDAMRAQMTQKMGYGNMGGVGVKKAGLGVQTGLPALDRVLNRDNSELVKKFKR